MKKSLYCLLILISASSCEITHLLFSNEKPSIELKEGKAYVNGVLGKTFYRKLQKFVSDYPDVKTLVLENVPGSINDEWNVLTCMYINKLNMNTELLSHSEVASGGVDLFISGKQRILAKGSKLGVHSWSDGKKDGVEYPRTSKEHDVFINFFNEIKMDTAFYWYTLKAAPANDIHWMTEEEVDAFRLER